MKHFYRRSVLITSVVAVALGVALLARTAAEGGGSVGYVFGGLFIALGTARLYLLRKT